MPQVPLEYRLTAVQIEKICTGLRASQSMELLFLREGVPRRTYYDTKKRLEDALLAYEEGQPVDQRRYDVAVKLFSAWADGGLSNIETLIKLGDENKRWQHRAWLAERSWWQIFGRRVVLEDAPLGGDSPDAGDGPKAGETAGLQGDIRLSRLRAALQRDATEVRAPRAADRHAVDNVAQQLDTKVSKVSKTKKGKPHAKR